MKFSDTRIISLFMEVWRVGGVEYYNRKFQFMILYYFI